MLNQIPAYQEDWNPAIAEGYDENKNEITLVFNCDITTQAKIENVIHYVVGRLSWGCRNFPLNAKIIISFDFRGQGIIISKSREFKSTIIEYVDNLKIDSEILIDFLI